MAVDETLLESVGSGAAGTTVRFYAWNQRALSLGCAELSADVDQVACQALDVAVIRRQSGGTAVYHDSFQLGYALALPAGHALIATDVVETYRRCARPVAAALRILGRAARLASIAEAQARSAEVGADSAASRACLVAIAPYEVLVDGRKVVAHAQVRRRAVLVHGLVLLRHAPAEYARLFALPGHEQLRVAALLGRKIGQLASHSAPLRQRDVAGAITAALACVLGADPAIEALSAAEELRAVNLSQEKYSAPGWTFRR